MSKYISIYYMSGVFGAIDTLTDLAYAALSCALVILAFAIPFFIITFIYNKVKDRREAKKVTTQYFWWDMNENSLKK